MWKPSSSLEERHESESPKRIISASGGPEPLQKHLCFETVSLTKIRDGLGWLQMVLKLVTR